MEKDSEEIKTPKAKRRFRVKERFFVPLVALLIACWAYAFNSPALALIAAFALSYSVIRHLAYRARQRHRLGSYEEEVQEEDAEDKWDLIGCAWVLMVFVMLVVLSMNSKSRFAQPGSRRYHIYKDCVMMSKKKEIKQYSYDADIYIMQLTLCQECNIRRLKAQRAWYDVYRTNIRKERYKINHPVILNKQKDSDGKTEAEQGMETEEVEVNEESQELEVGEIQDGQ